ncbi:MAG: alpha/beta hydrolase [Nevskia sp.]|nr:alpha/beta hydrolase [Nevskia sp.]
MVAATQTACNEIKDHSFFLEGGDVGVLLIHGLTGTPVEMRYVGKGLHKAGFTVYGMQLPGHCGNQTDLSATCWKDWYAAVEHALEALRMRVKTVVVGGLSMGAVMALHLAAKQGEKVSGLLLYGTTLWYDGWSIPWYSFLWKPLINTPLGRNYTFMEKYPYGIKDERLRKRVVQNLLSGNSADAGLAGMPACGVRQLWQLVATVKKELPSIYAPALILHAREDDMSSVRNAYYVARHLAGPVDVSLLDDCYHMITVDRQRDEVVSRSIEFLRRISAQATAHSGLRVATAS